MRYFIAFLLALVSLYPVAIDVATPSDIQWTTNELKVEPSGAVGISVTPGNGVFGAWAPLIASTSADWVLTAVIVEPVTARYAYVEIGIGAAASEVAVARTHGQMVLGAPNRYWWPIPLDVIPSGSRVSIRIHNNGTPGGAWLVRLEYYEKPIVGNLITTTASTLLSGTGANVDCGFNWANSAWTQVLASTAADYTLAGITYVSAEGENAEVEVDVGVGGAGSEAVVTTFKFSMNTAATGTFGAQYAVLWPVLDDSLIPTGSRLSFRCRSSDTNDAYLVAVRDVVYQDVSENISSISTLLPLKWIPSAASSTSLSGGVAWGDPAWTQFIASTSTPISINAITTNSNNEDLIQLEFGTGAAASEVEQTLLRFMTGQTTKFPSHVNYFPNFSIPTSTRVVMRQRASDPGIANTYSIGYYESPDFPVVTERQRTWPSGAPISITPNASAWAYSDYEELEDVTTGPVLLRHIAIDFPAAVQGASSANYEFQLAVGGAGSEVPFTTISGMTNYGTDFSFFPAMHKIAAGNRISARIRKEGTDVNAWGIAVIYLDDTLTGGNNIPWQWVPWNKPRWVN